MKQTLIFLMILLFSQQAFSSDNYFKDEHIIKFKFGGWSKHKPVVKYYDIPPINENHRGVGIEYYRELNDYDNHYLGLGAWYMEDSFFMDSIYLAAAYEYKIPIDEYSIFDSIDLNFNVGFASRSERTIVYYVEYDKNGNLTNEEYGYNVDERVSTLMTMPIITLNVNKQFHIDFTYIPEAFAESLGGGYELFFFRFGYTL